MKNNKTNILTFLLPVCLSLSLSLSAQPTACGPIVNTGVNHSIIIANLGPTFNGQPLPLGSYIIVRYEREGALVCGGFTQWNGENTFLAAYGDDTTTPEKDGFANGETFKFLLELPDGTAIEDEDIQVEYLTGGIYSHTGEFAVNGISGLAAFTASTGVQVNIVALLQGAYDSGAGLMSDDLRAGHLLPLTEPYTGLGYAHIGGGGETVQQSIFDISGPDAMVDWVFLELRDQADFSAVLATRSALLQSDGDIVDVDGFSPVFFSNLIEDDYYLTVKHRNHLGVMTAMAISLSAVTVEVNFTTDLNQTFGGANGIAALEGNRFGLFSGDFNYNGQVQNTDFAGMVLTLGTAGYQAGDFDLNGQVQNTDLQLKLVPNIGRGQSF